MALAAAGSLTASLAVAAAAPPAAAGPAAAGTPAAGGTRPVLLITGARLAMLPGPAGLFARGVSIALAGGRRPGPPRPRFVMHTITIHGTDLAGRPDNGDTVSLISADNTNRVAGGGVFRHGIARVTVPAGHYWAS